MIVHVDLELELEVDVSMCAGSRATRSEPGCAPGIDEVEAVRLNRYENRKLVASVDLLAMGVLDQATLDMIREQAEERALEQLEPDPDRDRDDWREPA